MVVVGAIVVDVVVVGGVAAAVGTTVVTTVSVTGVRVVQSFSSSGQSCKPSHHLSRARHSLLVGQIFVLFVQGSQRQSQAGVRVGTRSYKMVL